MLGLFDVTKGDRPNVRDAALVVTGEYMYIIYGMFKDVIDVSYRNRNIFKKKLALYMSLALNIDMKI